MGIRRLLITAMLLLCSLSGYAQFTARAETGVVFNGYNDISVPGYSGTRFSLVDDLHGKASAYYRLSVQYTIGQRHNITALFSPLDMTYRGCMSESVLFAGTLFAAHNYVEAKYRFYSYRLSYRYDIVMREKFEFGFGLTAKIRQARISMRSATKYDEKRNVGFVPLINFRLNWKYHHRWALLLEGDALGAPQGRAEDILVATTFDLTKRINLSLGYRLLEGGSDSREVYTISMFHYLSFGVQYAF